jgi:hypothetical protein
MHVHTYWLIVTAKVGVLRDSHNSDSAVFLNDM